MNDFKLGMSKEEVLQSFGEPNSVQRVPKINLEELNAGISRQFEDQSFTEIWQYHGRGPIYNSDGFEKIGDITIGAVLNDEGEVSGVGWHEGHSRFPARD